MKFFHGWGFPSATFSPLKGDARGYFFEEREKCPSSKVLVAHSFGLHCIPNEELKGCEELVILSGFISLKKDRVSLRTMKRELLRDPASLLDAFYREAGYHKRAPWLKRKINVSLLIEDLGRMEEELDISSILTIPKVAIWHATEDQIVARELGLALLDRLPQAKWLEMEGGHMATIERWIEQQQSKKTSLEP